MVSPGAAVLRWANLNILLDMNPRSSLSTHVMHNLGQRRARWLREYARARPLAKVDMTDSFGDRPGKKLVILQGRGYPTPEAARDKMRESLERDGIVVPEEDIVARTWTDKPVFCPWEAVAWIPNEKP